MVAVTKTVSAPVIAEAVSFGITNLGENKVQEAMGKRAELDGLISSSDSGGSRAVQHHLLGPLQTNKARKAVELFNLIQTVDRPKVASFLDRVAGELGKRQRCLIEVKISPEPTKSGISMSEAPAFIQGFRQYAHLELEGLMTIAPYDLPREETRAVFKNFKTFFNSQASHLGPHPILSMGMTDDFEVAIEEGATMVRIGRGLFGERNV